MPAPKGHPFAPLSSRLLRSFWPNVLLIYSLLCILEIVSLILVFHSYLIAEVRFLSVLVKARHQGKEEEGSRLYET